jgi:hypothetical protein
VVPRDAGAEGAVTGGGEEGPASPRSGRHGAAYFCMHFWNSGVFAQPQDPSGE